MLLVGVLGLLEDLDILASLFCLAECLISLGSVLEWSCENGVAFLLHE